MTSYFKKDPPVNTGDLDAEIARFLECKTVSHILSDI